LAVRIETPAKASPELEARVRRALLARTEKLSERLAEGTLKALVIDLLRPGQLARNPRTGKLKSPLDERI
jgi:hypothetical protein